MKKKTLLYIVLALAVVGVGVYFYLGANEAKAQIEPELDEASLNDISTSVTATGTLEAVTTVEVGTQVSGIVSKLYVGYNSEVKKGQLLAELDRTNLTSELTSQQASLRSAQTDLQYQQKNFARYSELYSKQLVSANEYDVALQSLRKAEEQVKVEQENVTKAETNLGYAYIYSPIDGIVISKDIEEGQTVASSFSSPTLFTIAKDLRDMQVIADVDEADIGGVAEGQRVTFSVDAFPDDVFSGTVTQVRQNATTTNNVVTYEVVITAPNSDLKLKPGLTASVTIYTLERTNVLSVPARALRFTPEPTVVGKRYKINDVQAEKKVWTLEGTTFTAHAVKVGTSDGVHTEILEGITDGTKVVVDMKQVAPGSHGGPNETVSEAEDSSEGSEETSSPFMPGRPGGGKK